MWWMALAALGGLIVGAKSHALSVRDSLRVHLRNQAGDRAFLLRILRRELANWLVRRNPFRFLKTYHKAHDAAVELLAKDARVQRAQLLVLCERHPMYTDFDFIGVREYVLYADALGISDYETVEQHFLDLLTFQTLQQALDENWRYWAAESADDLDHLEKYVRRVKDTRFKARLQRAAELHDAYQAGCFPVGESFGPDNDPLFETEQFSVHRLSHFCETRRGFHFKDTDERGIQGIFHGDERSYHHYLRSGPDFINEQFLDAMRLDEAI